MNLLRSVVFFISASVLPVMAANGEDQPQFTLGSCGGAMTGYDGRSYPCEADRKPACDSSTGLRCRCLERVECGGHRDEDF